MIRTIIISEPKTPRLRIRKVISPESPKLDGKIRVAVYHGGGVCNSYGYPAETEVVLVITTKDLRIESWSRVPANKVTLGGSAMAASMAAANKLGLDWNSFSNIRWIFDKRAGIDLEARGYGDVEKLIEAVKRSNNL